MRDEEPALLFLLHANVTLVFVLLTTCGRLGGPGGVPLFSIFSCAAFDTVKEAVQDECPLRDEATHLYIPLSEVSNAVIDTK